MDKVQKIRKEVERINLYTQSEVLKQVLDYIDSLQEEPKPKFNKGDKIQSVGKSTGHIYTFTIKEIQDDCYVLDDGKVLTFNMQDSWELVKEPVSKEFEKTFISMVNATHENNGSYSLHDFAQRLYNIAKEELEEPVTKELEEAAYQYANCFKNQFEMASMAFIKGAKWQKQQDLSPSTELSNFIDKLSKQFPEVSFAKLSRIAVRVAKWQQQQEYTCYEEAFEDGAKWKAEQFEQERLKHCDELTEAQAQIESDFVTQHLKENNRTPTFIDAIEYGMQMMKEQLMKDAHECEVKVDAGGYPYIPQIELYDYDKDEPLAKKGDKYKVILVEEG